MTCWLSDFLVGRMIQVNVNGFLSNQINHKAGVPQGYVLSPLLSWFTSTTFQHYTASKIHHPNSLMILLSLKVCFAAKPLEQNVVNLAMWCAKWRIKLNPRKTKVIIFSRYILARKTEPNLKLYDETLKVYPQVKFLGISFDSQLTFKNTLRTSWTTATPGTTD